MDSRRLGEAAAAVRGGVPSAPRRSGGTRVSDPLAGGERRGAHRPQQRQSLGLCPAAISPAEGRGSRLTSLLAPRGDPEHRGQERDASAAAHLGGPGRSPRPRAGTLQSNLCSAAGHSPPAPRTPLAPPRRPPPRWAPPRAGPGRGNPSPREALALRPLGLAGTRRSQPTLELSPALRREQSIRQHRVQSGWRGRLAAASRS